MQMIEPKAKSNLLYVSQEAFDQMQRIPTIDAEVVVRCKDCKYSSEMDEVLNTRFCSTYGCEVIADDFCSYGERIADDREPKP